MHASAKLFWTKNLEWLTRSREKIDPRMPSVVDTDTPYTKTLITPLQILSILSSPDLYDTKSSSQVLNRLSELYKRCENSIDTCLDICTELQRSEEARACAVCSDATSTFDTNTNTPFVYNIE